MAKTKSRGRRAEKKAEKEVEGVGFVIDDGANKPAPSKDEENVEEDNGEQVTPGALKPTFFGLVDANEIDYFKQAESTLNINSFESQEEREGFITSVLEESKGKELKLVTNQICSKLMERLILSGNDKQAKQIFQLFGNHFVSLAAHKYSSHVLETLLVRVAAVIEKEIIDDVEQENNDEDEDDREQFPVTMEHSFIEMLKEFRPHLKVMMEHSYASHVLRLVILIISGKELPSTTISNSTLRSKKSKIARKMIEIKDFDHFNRAYQVPASFKNELKHICNEITKDQTLNSMRQLAVHKIASPVIQLLIQVEGIIDRERAVWHLIFLNENEASDPKEEAFVEYLLSDSVGSHFFEALIKNGGARMKYIERLYKLYMKDRILKLTRRLTTGVYIVQALLFKLKPNEIEYILDQIIPELVDLISISENRNLELSQTVIDASIQRNNYRRQELIDQLFKRFAPNYSYDNVENSSEFLENVLQLSSSTLGNTRDDWPTAEERRRALLLEKFMAYDYSFVLCTWHNFFAIPERFIQMCTHGVFSHVVEKSLVVKMPNEDGGETKDILVLRKRLLNLFQGKIVDLACNSYGSHIVDKLWDFTVLLNMYKDRFGTELASESHKVKESIYGKLVWKNWAMELFVRKKYDWKHLIKEQQEDYYSGAENTESEPTKKPIELKLEKMYKAKQQSERPKPFEAREAASKKQKVRGRNR